MDIWALIPANEHSGLLPIIVLQPLLQETLKLLNQYLTRKSKRTPSGRPVDSWRSLKVITASLGDFVLVSLSYSSTTTQPLCSISISRWKQIRPFLATHASLTPARVFPFHPSTWCLESRLLYAMLKLPRRLCDNWRRLFYLLIRLLALWARREEIESLLDLGPWKHFGISSGLNTRSESSITCGTSVGPHKYNQRLLSKIASQCGFRWSDRETPCPTAQAHVDPLRTGISWWGFHQSLNVRGMMLGCPLLQCHGEFAIQWPQVFTRDGKGCLRQQLQKMITIKLMTRVLG